MDVDFAIIGGGIVGSAIAYGLATCARNVLVLDGRDDGFRAAQANFGLIWYQSKGVGMAAYQRLTRLSVLEWRDFHAEIEDVSDVCTEYEAQGGLGYCLGAAELAERQARIAQLAAQMPDPGIEILSRSEVMRLHPGLRLGDDISGASFSALDAHVNPLRLLLALQQAYLRLGGRIRRNAVVARITALPTGFEIGLADGRLHANRVIIATGESGPELAHMLGIELPCVAQRGQIIVTERLGRMLPFPSDRIRQTRGGTLMVGGTKETVGFDSGTTADAAAALAHRCVRIFPDLAEATVIRQWSGRRVITPDTAPIYVESAAFPGAFACICHSGVTLAASHARHLAPHIAGHRPWAAMSQFGTERFHVQAA